VANKLLISDANILIDMIVGGLLDDIFRLDYEFGLPDKGLQVMALESAAVEDTGSLYQRHRSSGGEIHACRPAVAVMAAGNAGRPVAGSFLAIRWL